MNIANSIPRFPGVSFPDFAIAVPPLGSGLGGLHWSRVKVMIEAAFEEMPDVRVRLYEPKGSPEAKDMPVGTAKPKITVAPDQYRRIKAELKP